MAYAPQYIPQTPPTRDTAMGQYSNFWNDMPDPSTPYQGIGNQAKSLASRLYDQVGAYMNGQGQQQQQGLPAMGNYGGLGSAFSDRNRLGNLNSYGYGSAPTAQQAKPFMNELLGGQRDQMDSLVKRMAGAGIRRGGMNVQGGAPLESSMYQQGIKQLGQGYGDRYGQAMGLAQNQANFNRQKALDSSSWDASRNQQNQNRQAAVANWGRQQAQDRYNSGVAQTQYGNQLANQGNSNYMNLLSLLGNQQTGLLNTQLQAASGGAQARQNQTNAQNQDYGRDISNWNRWRGAL